MKLRRPHIVGFFGPGKNHTSGTKVLLMLRNSLACYLLHSIKRTLSGTPYMKYRLTLLVSNCKVLRRAQTQTLEQTFTKVQTRENFWVLNLEFKTLKQPLLVYFYRPSIEIEHAESMKLGICMSLFAKRIQFRKKCIYILHMHYILISVRLWNFKDGGV